MTRLITVLLVIALAGNVMAEPCMEYVTYRWTSRDSGGCIGVKWLTPGSGRFGCGYQSGGLYLNHQAISGDLLFGVVQIENLSEGDVVSMVMEATKWRFAGVWGQSGADIEDHDYLGFSRLLVPPQVPSSYTAETPQTVVVPAGYSSLIVGIHAVASTSSGASSVKEIEVVFPATAVLRTPDGVVSEDKPTFGRVKSMFR